MPFCALNVLFTFKQILLFSLCIIPIHQKTFGHLINSVIGTANDLSSVFSWHLNPPFSDHPCGLKIQCDSILLGYIQAIYRDQEFRVAGYLNLKVIKVVDVVQVQRSSLIWRDPFQRALPIFPLANGQKFLLIDSLPPKDGMGPKSRPLGKTFHQMRSEDMPSPRITRQYSLLCKA